MIDLSTLTIQKAHDALKSGEYTVRQLAEAYLDVIKEKNPTVNAYLEIYDDVMEQADKAQKRFTDGTATIMTGIPLAIKDNILVEGKEVTAASKILSGYHATYDATAIKNLKAHNAVFLGRTNMDEFAMGSSTETSAYGVTRNPLDLERVPGGSSGGSASAVAMNGALAALGSETCGSIRQPAAFCGLVGFKPTYGTVSRHGLIAMGSSLDQIGPFGKTVSDVRILHEVLSSHDVMDSTSVPLDQRISKKDPATNGKRIGVPVECFRGEGIDPEIQASFSRSIDLLKSAGYEIVEISLPLISYSLAVYYILMPAESSTNLARFDGIRYGKQVIGDNLLDTYKLSRGTGFGREVRRRILLGTYVLSHGYYDAYYNKAVKVREEITKEMEKTFQNVDFIVTPTTPTPPFKIGEKMSDPVAMYLSDIFSAPANLSGCPAIAVPAGKTANGLPASIQITAPKWSDMTLFTIAEEFEKLV
jgi:aspartyl-tRNA(Asn)/glutamyl-tRNA(Gln) amidotransferase subunit A